MKKYKASFIYELDNGDRIHAVHQEFVLPNNLNIITYIRENFKVVSSITVIFEDNTLLNS